MIPTQLFSGAARILVAACLLGIAFNHIHPLGVRSAGSTTETGALQGTAAAAEVLEGLSNRTVALRLLPVLGRDGNEHGTVASAPEALQQPGSDAGTIATSERPAVLGSLTWRQTKTLLANRRIVLVDARTSEAYGAGHIPGAVSLPANFSSAEMAEFVEKYPKSTPIVVYCASSQCPLSRRLAAVLSQKQGYAEVRDMPGGYAEWRLAENTPSDSPTLAHAAK